MDDLTPDQTSTAIRWLRINSGLMVTIVGLISGAIGALVSGTWQVAHYDARMLRLEASVAAVNNVLGDPLTEVKRVLAEHTARLDLLPDQRLNEVDQMGTIKGRIAVLEQQVKFLGDRVAENATTAHRESRR